jgi:hypothetical protein
MENAPVFIKADNAEKEIEIEKHLKTNNKIDYCFSHADRKIKEIGRNVLRKINSWACSLTTNICITQRTLKIH